MRFKSFPLFVVSGLIAVSGCAHQSPSPSVRKSSPPIVLGSFEQNFENTTKELVFEALQQVLQEEGYQIRQLDLRESSLLAVQSELSPSQTPQGLSKNAVDERNLPARFPTWTRYGSDFQKLLSRLEAHVESVSSHQTRVSFEVQNPLPSGLTRAALQDSVRRKLSEIFEKIDFRLKIAEAFRGEHGLPNHADSF